MDKEFFPWTNWRFIQKNRFLSWRVSKQKIQNWKGTFQSLSSKKILLPCEIPSRCLSSFTNEAEFVRSFCNPEPFLVRLPKTLRTECSFTLLEQLPTKSWRDWPMFSINEPLNICKARFPNISNPVLHPCFLDFSPLYVAFVGALLCNLAHYHCLLISGVVSNHWHYPLIL